MATLQPAVHRAILIVDVESFGDPARTNADQLTVRDTMYKALRRSFARARISWAGCVKEDRGDGALVLIPPGVPKSRLVTGLPAYLAEALARHNAARSFSFCMNPSDEPQRKPDGERRGEERQ